jgi:hypothetical protein
MSMKKKKIKQQTKEQKKWTLRELNPGPLPRFSDSQGILC